MIYQHFKSIDKYLVGSSGEILNSKTGRFLKIAKDKKGYLFIQLSINGFVETKRIHRLVYELYVGEIPDSLEVNHIDGNKQNNHYENLELVTHHENILHAVKTGLIKSGIDSPLSKGYIYQYCFLKCKIVALYGSCFEASKKSGVSASSINLCINHKRRSAGGFKWYRLKSGIS